jgi:hypothetical protein
MNENKDVIDDDIDELVADWLTVPDVAEIFGVPVTRVRQLIAERQILALRRDGVLRVPAAIIQDGASVKGLAGTITLLADAGFDDDDMVRWLFRSDESLPGSPVAALRENRGTEVRRRAHAAGF